MTALRDALVIDATVTQSGGGFAVHGETVDLDPDDGGDLANGDPIAYSDGTLTTDAVLGHNLALVSATVTYEDGSRVSYDRLILQTLADGRTLIYASRIPGATTSPEPETGQSALSIDISPFLFTAAGLSGDPETQTGDLGDGDPACFAAGTPILTPDGPRAVETIGKGDLVVTADNGAVPVLWAGGTSIPATRLAVRPDLAPIRLDPGLVGNAAPLVLSPCHRVMISGWRAEVLHGATEILVAARDLLGQPGVRRLRPRGGVRYHHLLLERHEILFAAGARAESLHPDLAALPRTLRAEVLDLFPELARPGGPRPHAARPALAPGMAALSAL